MAVTEKQLEANRTNGAKSSGPTSLDGKDRSKMNAVKHGLTSRPGLITEGDGRESIEDYEQLRTSVREEFAPETLYDVARADHITELSWRAQRAQRAELAVLRGPRNAASLRARVARTQAVERAVQDFSKLSDVREASALHLVPEYPLSRDHRRALFESSTGLDWVVAFLVDLRDTIANGDPADDAQLDRLRSMYGPEHALYVTCAEPTPRERLRQSPSALSTIALLESEIERLGRDRVGYARAEDLELEVRIDLGGYLDTKDLVKLRRYETSIRNELRKEVNEYWRNRAARTKGRGLSAENQGT
jgi:hypothetical protein